MKVSNPSVLISMKHGVTNFDKYEIFPKLNRKIDESNVRQLVESFKQFGTASAKVTIIKTKSVTGRVKLFQGDGQHSIIAAGRLGLPLLVVTVELADDTLLNVTKYVAALNNNAKAWSTHNFLNAFACNGIDEYKIVGNMVEQSGLTITDMLYIFLGSASRENNNTFKSGKLKFIDYNDSYELWEAVCSVKQYIPNKAYARRAIYPIFRMAKDYKRMAKVIIKAGRSMEIAQTKFSENEADFTAQLQRLYRAEFKRK